MLIDRPNAKYRWCIRQGGNEVKLNTQQMYELMSSFMAQVLSRG